MTKKASDRSLKTNDSLAETKDCLCGVCDLTARLV